MTGGGRLTTREVSALVLGVLITLVLGAAAGLLQAPRWSHTRAIDFDEHLEEGAKAGAEKEGDLVVATVNGRPITGRVLSTEMVRRGGDFLGGYDELAEKEALLDEIIRQEVLAQAAAKAGYGDDPEIVASAARLAAEKYWRSEVLPRLPEVEVSDEEVHAYYDAPLTEYTEPERSRAAIIFLKFPPRASTAEKEALRREADDIVAAARAAERKERTWGALALRSDDTGNRERGGDVGWIARDARVHLWEGEVLEALSALETPGDIAPPIETRRGVYLVKLIERSGGVALKLEAVAPRIRSALATAKREEVVRNAHVQLAEGFRVEIDREVLAQVGPRTRVADNSHRPPEFPLGRGVGE